VARDGPARHRDGAFAVSSGGDGSILAGVGFSGCLFGGVVVDYALPTAEKRKPQKIIMFFVSIGFISLLVVSALDHRFGWSVVPPSVVIAGNILVGVGFYVTFLVYKENPFSSATIEVAEDQSVISTGPYAYVRHPMYAGGLLYIGGMPLALGSYWCLLVLAVMSPFLIWRLFDEEDFLSKNLRGYKEYCAKVRWRLIPGIF
jgi:protein-S-isoprenylcysteine O-methyltransferase Ste14